MIAQEGYEELADTRCMGSCRIFVSVACMVVMVPLLLLLLFVASVVAMVGMFVAVTLADMLAVQVV